MTLSVITDSAQGSAALELLDGALCSEKGAFILQEELPASLLGADEGMPEKRVGWTRKRLCNSTNPGFLFTLGWLLCVSA